MKKLLKASAWIAGPFTILFCLYSLFMEWTRFVPPDVRLPSVSEMSTVNGKTALLLGPSGNDRSRYGWLARTGGLWEMHLSGGPADLGTAQSLLGSFLMREQEAYFIDELERMVPSRWIQRLLKMYVRWHFRKLDEQVPASYKEELRAMALTYPDPYLHMEETYQRFLYLHAFHDVTQGLERSPLIACSAFGVWGSYTRNGCLILGRNFDFEEGKIFDSQKAVIFFRPFEGIPFASIAWAGMAGVVTGLNAEGIFISVNAARSRETRNQGIPVVFLLRRVLQEARTLDEALSILLEAPTMVADIFLLGDGKARKAIVVEKAPYRMEVREGKGVVVATNHFLKEPLREDPENTRILKTTSTLSRYQRLEDLLLKGSEEKIQPETALDILRDRRGVGDVPLAPGNRNALNALLACHSVVVNATEGLIWVSEAPNLLGPYRCFDLKKVFHDTAHTARRPSMDLPADPLLVSGDYDRYILFLEYLKMARALSTRGHLNEALDYARRALSLFPDHPQANLLAGRISLQREDRKGADDFFRRYLQAHPSNPAEAASIARLLAEGK